MVYVIWLPQRRFFYWRRPSNSKCHLMLSLHSLQVVRIQDLLTNDLQNSQMYNSAFLNFIFPVHLATSSKFCLPVAVPLTYSMVQSPSWEANWFAASQEIPRISRNPKVHYRAHKRPPPVTILDQPSPVHIPTSHLLEIHRYPYCPLYSWFPKRGNKIFFFREASVIARKHFPVWDSATRINVVKKTPCLTLAALPMTKRDG